MIFCLVAGSQPQCRPPAPLTTITHTPLHPVTDTSPGAIQLLRLSMPPPATAGSIPSAGDMGAGYQDVPCPHHRAVGTEGWQEWGCQRKDAPEQGQLQAPMAKGVQDPQDHSSAPQGVSASRHLLHRVHLAAQSLITAHCTACPGHEQFHPVVQGSLLWALQRCWQWPQQPQGGGTPKTRFNRAFGPNTSTPEAPKGESAV